MFFFRFNSDKQIVQVNCRKFGKPVWLVSSATTATFRLFNLYYSNLYLKCKYKDYWPRRFYFHNSVHFYVSRNPLVNCDSASIPRLDLVPWASRSPPEVWHIGEGGVKWHLNCDFPGHDVSNQVTTGERCGRLCINDDRCNAFSHHQGKCFLKNVPATLLRTRTREGVCGLLPWKF